jgi:glycosyltransferase involved in cell wall biosynthesis
MKYVNVIRRDNGFGLTRSGGVLANILRDAGFAVTVSGPEPAPGPLPGSRPGGRHAYDINLFLEEVLPAWFDHARVNCLIPNQEWFFRKWQPLLDRFDLVLCKTHCAEAIFKGLGCRTEYISYTSQDHFEPGVPRDKDSFFHAAGRSKNKGTDALIDLWRRHPDWPTLRLLRHQRRACHVEAANIDQTIGYQDDVVLRQLQNACGVHLFPSEVEGFGHAIVEAMSCAAVTVTTDAPPMNEIVTPARGLLVGYRNTAPFMLGTRYRFDPEAMEARVEEILGMDGQARRRLGEAARQWFLQNDTFFRRRLIEVLAGV